MVRVPLKHINMSICELWCDKLAHEGFQVHYFCDARLTWVITLRWNSEYMKVHESVQLLTVM